MFFALAALALAKGPVTGLAFHLCSCLAPCPCMDRKDGDVPGCQITAVYHITSGGYVGHDVDGLTMVVVSRPEPLVEADKANKVRNPVSAAVYVPDTATEKQRRDLMFILTEHNMRFGWGNLNMRPVPLRFGKNGDTYTLAIPGVLYAETAPMRDAQGKALAKHNVQFSEGSTWSLGQTKSHSYKDPKEPSWSWDYPANNGAWCAFRWDRIDHP